MSDTKRMKLEEARQEAREAVTAGDAARAVRITSEYVGQLQGDYDEMEERVKRLNRMIDLLAIARLGRRGRGRR